MFKVQKENLKICEPRILYPAQIFFKNEKQMETQLKPSMDQKSNLGTILLSSHHSLFTDKDTGSLRGEALGKPLARSHTCSRASAVCASGMFLHPHHRASWCHPLKPQAQMGSQLSHQVRSAKPTQSWVLQVTLSWVQKNTMKAHAALPLGRSPLPSAVALGWQGRVGRGSVGHGTQRHQSTPWNWAPRSPGRQGPELPGRGGRKPHHGPAWA